MGWGVPKFWCSYTKSTLGTNSPRTWADEQVIWCRSELSHWSVGLQSVPQVIRFRRSDCFETNSCNFKVDTMTHRQPMEFPQVFSYVFRPSHTGVHTGGKVLNSLESPDVEGRHSGEDGITVVDSRTQHWACNSVGALLRDRSSNVPQGPDVVHGIATHSLYVIVEVQMFIERHAEQLNFGGEFNFDSADRQGVDAGVSLVMPNWAHIKHLGFVRIQRHSVEGEPGLNLQCAFGQPLDLCYSIIAWNSDEKWRVVRVLVLLDTDGSGDVGDRGDKRWKQQRSKDRSLRNADHTLSRGRALSVTVDDLWSSV